ncbi:MAG: NTP transferase domain-containing protein [Muribaculaceae bacterium]|nr:NTP transferase domain-containing protein [Muribaculaceae bacterium]
MKAFILAAGLGTRLRPWTLEHPKALVPVGGVPMLERVILRMRDQGFDDITVNVHHFADQIVDFLNTRDFGVSIHVSDERERLLDTGGAILHAARFLASDPAPFLVHNVDILSDAPLASLMQKHVGSGRDISLVTSDRKSSRRLLFDSSGKLSGWHNLATDEYRPEGFCRHVEDGLSENAFSGIYVVSANAVDSFREYADKIGSTSFPLMDYLLQRPQKTDIGEIRLDSLNLIDIGKPETLGVAESLWSGK